MKTKKINEEKHVIDLNDEQLDLITNIMRSDWDVHANEVKDTLTMLTRCYLKSEEIDGAEDQRNEVSFHLYLLTELMNDLRKVALAEN